MMKKLKVLDLLSGIGGRALGFQQAGFEVVCAVDNNLLCKDVYCQIINNTKFIVSDITDIRIEELPFTEVITAKLLSQTTRSGRKKINPKDINKEIIKIIFNKMPPIFVLEMPPIMITSKQSAELKKLLEIEGFRRYTIQYQIFRESDFSGFSVIGNQAYVVGIRNDLVNEEFYFPKGETPRRMMFQENIENINDWYRKITLKTDIKFQTGMQYINERGIVSETKLIHMGSFREMYLVDSIGLRKFTHNEYAFLKGLSGYNFNQCSNRRDMYMRLAYASNVYISNAIASAVSKYLRTTYAETDNKKAVGEKCISTGVKKKILKKSLEDTVYPKLKLTNIHVDELKGIKNLDISFDKNLTAIMGVNGSGKSTILHILACIFKPFKAGENYKFSFFFTPNPDSSWKNSRLSISYWDENLQKEILRTYKKNTDRWAPRYADRPKRDTYYIGIETCIPEIEKEKQTSYIDYKTSLANDKISCKIIKDAAYILNKNYDNLNYHETKKKKLLGVHTTDGMGYSSLSMGAGEQRVLKILKTVYEANTYSLILIDEIDILLHVMALRKLINRLSEIAIQRNLQIIFTTHSIEMENMKTLVDIRYLEPLKEKTMVYNAITPDIIFELSGNIEKKLKVFVEDTLTEMIVNVVARDLGIFRNISVIKMGAARNAFIVAASFVLQEINTDNIFILLDGDVYRNEKNKKDEIQKVLSGTEKNHENKVEKAMSLVHQLTLPEGMEPEKYIFNMLIELDDKKEIVGIAKKIKAVNDSHEWLDELVIRMGERKELILFQIIELVSEHNRWNLYVKEIYDWLLMKKSKKIE